MSKPKTDKVHQWQKLVDDINSTALGRYFFECKFGKDTNLETLIEPNWRGDVLVKAEQGKATKKLKEHQLRNLQAFAKDLHRRDKEAEFMTSLNKIQREPEIVARLVELMLNLKQSLRFVQVRPGVQKQFEPRFKAEFNRDLENQKRRLRRSEARTIEFIRSLQSNFFPKTRCEKLIEEIRDAVELRIIELRDLGDPRARDSMRLFIWAINDFLNLDKIDDRKQMAELLQFFDIRKFFDIRNRNNQFFDEKDIKDLFYHYKEEAEEEEKKIAEENNYNPS